MTGVRFAVRGALLVVIGVAAAACSTQQRSAEDTAGGMATGAGGEAGMQSANQLTAEERSAGWRLLFDGNTPSEWRAYKKDAFSPDWFVVDGVLKKEKPTDDIITRAQFSDFELAFDWKLGAAANAGVFYRATEEYDYPYWSGPEYQLLDDAAHGDGKNRLTSAGAAYGLYPAPAGVVKPAGEWNTTRIVARGSHIEHWLNGQKLLEYELGSPDWEAKVKASKFGEWRNYGRAKRGHIAIQGDHEGTLELRNIRIRELTQ